MTRHADGGLVTGPEWMRLRPVRDGETSEKVVARDGTVTDLHGILEPVPPEYADYVTLWNDVRPIIEAAEKVVAWENRAGVGDVYLGVYAPAGRDLWEALQRYHELYPKHRRPAEATS